MLIRIGADHRGFELKERLKLFLHDQGYEVFDAGNAKYDKDDDYVDFATAVAKAVSLDPEQNRGILICGSGVGVDIVANKFPRVRAALGFSRDQVFAARHDDDANILCLAADFIEEEEAKNIVKIFMQTYFGREERYLRRLGKIKELEESNPE